MFYHKNLRVPFIIKLLKQITWEPEVKCNIIAKKFRGIKQNNESALLKKPDNFYLNAVQLNLDHSLLFRKLDHVHCGSPLIRLFSTYASSNLTMYSVRHYSQNSFQNVNSKKWIIVILGGLSAGLGIAMVLYPDSLKGRSAAEPMIIEQPSQPKPIRFPLSPEEIPDEIPYLIIGGGTAAFAAFRAIKSSEPTAKVLVVTNELYNPYMRPPLSKELIFNKSDEEEDKFYFKQWNGRIRSVFFEPDEFYTSCEELIVSENGGVSVARGWNVKHVDHNNKLVVLDDGKSIKYEKCLLATGSVPKKLPVLSENNLDVLKKVSYYRTLDEFSQLEDVTKDNTKSVVIVGNGFNGTELACSLARKGVKVTLMFEEENILTDYLPEYLAKSVKVKIEQQGVNVISNAKINQADYVNNKVCLYTVNGSVVTADHVVVALGVTPNTDLAEDAGLEIDKTLGGYFANAEFLVRRDLYAAGDCASFYDVKYGRRRIEHHDHAVISGRLAGENMTGKGKIFKTQSMFWSDLAPGLGLEAIGVVDSSLPTIAVYVHDPQTGSETEAQTSETIKQLGLTCPNILFYHQFICTLSTKGYQFIEQHIDWSKIYKFLEGGKGFLVWDSLTHFIVNVTQPSEFGRGVIFYLKNKMVVGVVLWNLYNRIPIARQVLKSNVAFDDFYEVSKHFKMYP